MTWSRSSTRSSRSRFPAALMRHSPRAPTLCDRILRLRRTRSPAAVRSLLSSSHRQATAKQRGLPFSMVGMLTMQDETRSQRYAIASLLCLVLAFGGGPASIIIAECRVASCEQSAFWWDLQHLSYGSSPASGLFNGFVCDTGSLHRRMSPHVQRSPRQLV